MMSAGGSVFHGTSSVHVRTGTPGEGGGGRGVCVLGGGGGPAVMLIGQTVKRC